MTGVTIPACSPGPQQRVGARPIRGRPAAGPRPTTANDGRRDERGRTRGSDRRAAGYPERRPQYGRRRGATPRGRAWTRVSRRSRPGGAGSTASGRRGRHPGEPRPDVRRDQPPVRGGRTIREPHGGPVRSDSAWAG
jgi:hypothetical protein